MPKGTARAGSPTTSLMRVPAQPNERTGHERYSVLQAKTDDGVRTLRIGKRFRLGWIDAEGKPSTLKRLKQSEAGQPLYYSELTAEESIQQSEKADPLTKVLHATDILPSLATGRRSPANLHSTGAVRHRAARAFGLFSAHMPNVRPLSFAVLSILVARSLCADPTVLPNGDIINYASPTERIATEQVPRYLTPSEKALIAEFAATGITGAAEWCAANLIECAEISREAREDMEKEEKNSLQQTADAAEEQENESDMRKAAQQRQRTLELEDAQREAERTAERKAKGKLEEATQRAEHDQYETIRHAKANAYSESWRLNYRERDDAAQQAAEKARRDTEIKKERQIEQAKSEAERQKQYEIQRAKNSAW